MISDIIFKGKVADDVDNYKYTDEFINYLIMDTLRENEGLSVEGIKSALSKVIPHNYMKTSKLKEHLLKYFYNENDRFYLALQQINTIEQIEKIQQKIHECLSQPIDEFGRQVGTLFDANNTPADVLAITGSYFIKAGEIEKDVLMSKLVEYYRNFDHFLKSVESGLERLGRDYGYLKIESIIKNEGLKLIFTNNNIATIGEMKTLDTTLITASLFYDIASTLESFDGLSAVINAEEEDYENELFCIDNLFNSFHIREFDCDKAALEVLEREGVTTVGLLKRMNLQKMTIICLTEGVNLRRFIEKIVADYKEAFFDVCLNSVSDIKDNEYDVIKRRSTVNHIPETLESIAQDFGITRERVRQIESKAKKKVTGRKSVLFAKLLRYYVEKKTSRLHPYVIMDDFVNEFVAATNNTCPKDDATDVVVLLINALNSGIIYAEKYGILYDSHKGDMDQIIKKTTKNLGDIISVLDVDGIDDFERNVIEKRYSLVANSAYVRKGVRKSSIYTELVRNNFREGINVSDEKAYNKVKRLCKKAYGTVKGFPVEHTLRAMLERDGFINIERGTLIAPEEAPKLPRQLLQDIFEYIEAYKPVVYYRSIFEEFNKELLVLGIDNFYFLKGCLDPCLSSKYTTKRDYITVGKRQLSSADAIVKFIRSFDGEFEMQDLRDRFPGVKDYVFYNQLAGEWENGLIQVSANTYIYYKKLNIEKSAIRELKGFVEKQFEALNTDIISVRKIYAKLAIFDKELLGKLNIEHGQFELFSIMKYCFKEYYYSRPLVSKHSLEEKTAFSLILDFAKEQDEFTLQTIRQYSDKMNIANIPRYLDFMETMSDEFVQVDVGKMMKKEKLEITSSQVSSIRNIIDLILSRNEEIIASRFTAFSMLPKLSVPWNMYLLIGVIRSYLDEFFEIEYTENTYNTTDFIVRRG